MNPDLLSDPDLPGLVSAALEDRDQGLHTPLHVLCGKRPDLEEAVRALVAKSQHLSGLREGCRQQDVLKGRVLAGRYRLESPLGAGAMGVVYSATDLLLGRAVAVKLLHATLLDTRESEQRFLREAEILASISHPSIVTIYDRGQTDEGAPFLVMELLEGQSLGELLSRCEEGEDASECPRADWVARAIGQEHVDEPTYLRTVAGWVVELAEGLEDAHALGVLHRDVKPSNILICRDGRPVLLDFGTATHVGRVPLTRDGSTLGTPVYMAPETLSSHHRPDVRVDVYGLSATLYHMLTLRQPYSGRPTQVLAALATKDPCPAQRLRPGLPRDLVAILDRGMARRPKDRYPSALSLGGDLKAFIEYRPVSARPLTPWTRAWRRARRSPVFWTLVALGVVGVFLAGGLLAHDRWQERRTARFLEAWSKIPPNLVIGDADRRLLPSGGRREWIRGLLDTTTEVRPAFLAGHALRATFLLDQGETSQATSEMERVASLLGSDYSRRLLERYRAFADQQRSPQGTQDLDLTGLPEPREPGDFYLAALHAMRSKDYPEAKAWLQEPCLSEDPGARELFLPFLERDPSRMLEETAWLEGRWGIRTATTAHWAAYALGRERRYGMALDRAQEGLKLAPESHRLHENAALAAWRLGELEEASEHYRAAWDLVPLATKPAELLIRVLMDMGELGEALVTLDQAPFGDDVEGQQRRVGLRAEIETERALVLWHEGDRGGAVEMARAATELFEQLEETQHPARAAIARALAAGSLDHVTAGLLDLLEASPTNARRLQVLLEWIPATLDQANTDALRAYLAALQSLLVLGRVTGQPPAVHDPR